MSTSLSSTMLLIAALIFFLFSPSAFCLDPAITTNTDPCPATSAGGSVTCPASCFRPDPVCGEDGVTYWCGCSEAACAGARVARRGFCPPGNGAGARVSGQALLLVHIVWLFLLGFSVVFGLL